MPTKMATTAPIGGDDHARAHYRRAGRYNHKRLAHLRRGDNYARLAAFGVDHSQPPATTLMVGSDPNPIDEENEDRLSDMPLSWTQTTNAQASAVDALLMHELRGEAGAVAYGGHGADVWSACRDRVAFDVINKVSFKDTLAFGVCHRQPRPFRDETRY
jgi:hypothetical protein